LIKIILETSLLTDDEINEGCRMCADAGADFVKTSTGFSSQGAQENHIRGMRELLPSNVGIKASGGIKTAEQAITLIKAGADRIGTSSGVEMMKELTGKRTSQRKS
ncbi:MAG: deoxyribose-phosphate aldolase, partial [Bacteroidota bacterium]